MNKEQIERAAMEACIIERNIYNDEYSPYYKEGFKDGALWRINSVWHLNTEMPSIGIDEYGSGKDCVVQPKYGVIEIGEAIFDEGIYAISCNRGVYTMDEIERWAYLDDLLPDKK